MECRGLWGSRGWWRPRVGEYRGSRDLEGRIGSGGGGGNSPEVGIGVMGGQGLVGMGM